MRSRSGDPKLERMMKLATLLDATMGDFGSGGSGSTFSQASTAQGAFIATNESSASVSYTDLTTPGPAVTVSVGPTGVLIVSLSSTHTNTQGTACFMGFALSGNNVLAASDANAVEAIIIAAGSQIQTIGGTVVVTGLVTGTTTVTAKYKVSGNTGQWKNRYLSVLTY